MSRVGVFASPDEAREFKQLLLQLRSSGFLLQGGQKRQPVFEAPQEFIVSNQSGEVIPPFAFMQCTEFNTDVIRVEKPADRYGAAGPFLINSGREIPIDGRGVGRNAGPLLLHTDDTSFALMTAQRRISPEVDEWSGIFNPAGCFVYFGDSPLRSSGGVVFGILDGYPQVIHAKTGVGGIPGATGVSTRVLGSAECTLWEDDGDGNLTESIDETIYNAMSTAITGSAHILATRNHRGKLIVVAEDCA